MIRLILYLSITLNLFGFQIDDTEINITSSNSTGVDIVKVEVPKEITRPSDKKASIEYAFVCPQTVVKIVANNTTYDTTYEYATIRNIDFTKGSYTCDYYNAVGKLGFTYRFTKNDYYMDLLKSKREKIIRGEKTLGFDYAKLQSDINSIQDSQTVDVDKIIESVGLNKNYDSKGFDTYSQMLTSIISFDDERIIGTNIKGDLLFRGQGNIYSDKNTDLTELINSNTKNDEKSVFGREHGVSWWQSALTYVGWYDAGEAASNNREELLNSVDSVDSFIDRSMVGSYFDLFISAEMFGFYFLLILIITTRIIVSMGWQQFRNKLVNIPRTMIKKEDGAVNYLAVTVMGFLFLVPFSSTIINEKQFNDGLSVAAQGISHIVGYTTDTADQITYDITKRKIKELANNSDVYSKEQLLSISEEIVNNLNYTSQQISTLELCRKTYFIDSFLNENIDLATADIQGEIYREGRVIEPRTCRNIEGSIYNNMQMVESDSKLLQHKIATLKKYDGLSPTEKAIGSVSHIYGSVSRDFGWMSIPLSYSIQKHYNDIALNLDDAKEAELDKNMDSYFSKNEFSDSSLISGGVDTVAFISSFAFLHNFSSFSKMQEMLYRQMSPSPITDEVTQDWFYDSKEQAKSKLKAKIQQGKQKVEKAKKNAKKKLIKYMSMVTPQGATAAIVDKFVGKLMNVMQEGAAIVLSHLVAKYAFIAGLTQFKLAGVIAIMLFSIVVYLVEVFVTVFYIGIFFLRFYKGAFTGEQNVSTGFLLSRIIYLVSFPIVFVFSVAFLHFGEQLLSHIFNLFTTLDIQTLKAVTYSVSSSQSIFDSIGTGVEAMLDLGMKMATYEIISIFIMFPMAYYITIHMPNKVIKMIDEAAEPRDNDLVNLSRKIEGKE